MESSSPAPGTGIASRSGIGMTCKPCDDHLDEAWEQDRRIKSERQTRAKQGSLGMEAVEIRRSYT